MSVESNDLYEQFIRLEWLVRRYQFKNMREYGPMMNKHKGQGRVLALLRLKPEISQKDLSSILDIRSQSLGELLSKLEKSGYITRTTSQTDRRIMEIKLTDAGKEAADRQQDTSDEEDLFGCLDEAEQNTLNGLFLKLIENLTRDLGDAEDPMRDRDVRNGFPFMGRHFDFSESAFAGRPPFDRDRFSDFEK